jgi:hypothetical protein
MENGAMLRAPPFTSEQTLFWHGVYLAAVALVLFLAPALLRFFLPFPAELDWWNRVLALPLFNLGILCAGGALTRSRTLIKLSVAMRLWVMAALTALVVVRLVPVIALVVGVIDLASAVLTTWALAAETQRPQSEARGFDR